MKVKKLLCLGMAALLMCSNLPQMEVHAQALNAEDAVIKMGIKEGKERVSNEVIDDYQYTELEDGGLKITKYNGNDTELVIPSKIEGKKVTSIGYGAFSDCNSLISVSIPNTVTNIEESAFQGCKSLSSLTIPSSVVSIGRSAFNGTQWLKNKQEEDALVVINHILINAGTYNGNVANIPKGVKSIAEGAFIGCTELTNVIIPDSVTNIGERAFHGCEKLADVSIPDSVTSIGKNAFWVCRGLTNVKISNSLTNIETGVFANCSSLTEVTIPNSVTNIGSSAFTGCSNLETVIIPDSVTSIEERAFSGCSNLEAVIIPDSVTKIGRYAFRETKWLENKRNDELPVIVNHILIDWKECSGNIDIPRNVTSIGGGAFSDCNSLISVNMSDSVTSIGNFAFSGCSSLTSVNIPDSVISIGEWVFSGCSRLTSVNIPDSITSIGRIFSGCSGLVNVNIPESETNIESSAFSGCSSLKSVIIPNGVTNIGKEAFYRSGLKSIDIPDSVINIERQAFLGCSSLTSVSISSNVTSIENEVFSDCSNLASIDIPNSVTNIGNEAFSGCSSLASIDIPNSVTNIGEYAFRGSGLKSLDIPDSVTTVGIHAFSKCNSLVSVNFPQSVVSIEYRSFSECSSLEHINISEGVTSIESEAFSKCSSLKRIDIPSSVISIGSESFSSCSGLEYVNISEGVTSIGTGAFSYCRNLASVVIPDSVTSIGHAVFACCDNLEKLEVSDGNVKYDSRKGCNAVIESRSNTLVLGCKGTTIPDSVMSIGEFAFWGCSGLTSAIFPESITDIKKYAFFACGLTNITIPQNVTNIGMCAFAANGYLTNAIIPNSVTNIEVNAFTSCDSLTIFAKKGSYAQTFAEENGIPFSIIEEPQQKQISDCEITLSSANYTYDGTAKQPSVTVKDGSTTLINGTDYTVSYSNNVNVGTATVTITGKGNYTGTTTKTFAINAQPDNEKSFEWGKSNWRFDNSGRYFSNYDVNNDVKIKMKNDFNLSNSEIKELEWKIAKNNASGFMGSCFGMTVSEIMAYQGGLKLSRYGGSDIVNQNTNTSNMTSVINFIQVLQSNSEMCQSIRQTPFLSGEFPQTEFIKKLSDVAANSNYLVKLSYKIVTKNTNNGSISNGYHAVLVYGMEKCNYYSPVTGKAYDRKILIADPNYLSGNALNSQACLYFKSSDCSWIVPYWNVTYSNGGVQSCYWNAESGEATNNGGIRNIMRYESLKEEVDLMSEFSAGHYIAGLEIDNKSQNVSSVEKVKNSGNPNADYTGDFSDEIVRYDMDMDDNIYMTEDDELYALWNPTSSYTLSYLKLSNYNLKMDYETVDYYADVTNSTYTLFKPGGSITLKGSDADYDIAMVTEDADCVTDWFSVAVSGTDVDNLVYAKVKDGYTLSASNLRNVKISAKGEDFTADATISTNYNDVFIYEIDKNTIGVKVDTDKNGTYETQIPTEETHQYSSEWKTDAKSHWKECKCGEKSGLSAHKFRWMIDKKATVHESGLKHEECTVCGYRRNENTVIDKQSIIPIKGQKLTDDKGGAVYKVVTAKTKGGTVEYTKPLSSKTANISIPSTVKIDDVSYKVTSIAANAFKNNKKITKAKVGSNVTSIGKNAFSGCRKLKILTIGNNVVSIGDNAFLNCTSLETVTIPAKVKKIGKQAFCGSKKLKTIKISTNKLVSKNVGSKAFAKIDLKATVKVPASCLKSYKKLLRKKGISGKKQKVIK